MACRVWGNTFILLSQPIGWVDSIALCCSLAHRLRRPKSYLEVTTQEYVLANSIFFNYLIHPTDRTFSYVCLYWKSNRKKWYKYRTKRYSEQLLCRRRHQHGMWIRLQRIFEQISKMKQVTTEYISSQTNWIGWLNENTKKNWRKNTEKLPQRERQKNNQRHACRGPHAKNVYAPLVCVHVQLNENLWIINWNRFFIVFMRHIKTISCFGFFPGNFVSPWFINARFMSSYIASIPFLFLETKFIPEFT